MNERFDRLKGSIAGVEDHIRLIKYFRESREDSTTGPLIDAMIGSSPATTTASKPRPLRVSLNVVNDSKLALSNRGKLRGFDQLKGISLRKDFTRKQQQKLKLQYESRQKELADNPLSLSDQPGASGTTRIRTRSSYSTDGRSKESKLLESSILKIGHQNMRSLNNKFHHVHFLVINFNLDILCLTESWLNSTKECCIPLGYDFVRSDRMSRAGGVAI